MNTRPIGYSSLTITGLVIYEVRECWTPWKKRIFHHLFRFSKISIIDKEEGPDYRSIIA
jgi:hypothetical protein